MIRETRLKTYFSSFDYQNKSKKAKFLPFVHRYSDYVLLIQYKYTIKEMKDIIKRMELPRCRETRKDKIQHHCTNLLFLSCAVTKIQKVWRNFFIRRFNETLGPSYKQFEVSNNVEDFLTTENIRDIDYYYYFSFRDKDQFVYTFHIVSIFSLIQKNMKMNPYNRNAFDVSVLELLSRRMRYNVILKKTHAITEYTPQSTTIEDRVLQLFHHMDQLGNYTSSEWFLELQPSALNTFIYELYEIWNFRAQLSTEIKEEICPPRGNPFVCLPRNFMSNYNNPRMNYPNHFLRNASVQIMERLAYSAHNDSNKNLGVLYILSALTLVSDGARSALPWLYASVYHNWYKTKNNLNTTHCYSV